MNSKALEDMEVELRSGAENGYRQDWLKFNGSKVIEVIKELRRRSETMERDEMVLAAIRGVVITADPHYFERRKINVINQLIGEILPAAVTNEIALWALKKREAILAGEKVAQ